MSDYKTVNIRINEKTRFNRWKGYILKILIYV